MAGEDSLVLEHLKRIQMELSHSRERDREALVRLSSLESAVARFGREQSVMFGEVVETRHSVDRLRERVERIEQRLELGAS